MYYINVYNVLVFVGVFECGLEMDSVWKGGFILGYGFFVKCKWMFDGRCLSLKKFEDDLICEGFEDLCIYVVFNCVLVSCLCLF